ncbi:cupin domain-containing protein [Conexibacter arvalis]|uniref:Quercetin dioxygenase-like cupin family protein n=1 Tax=Conexibacter arvalis TaxID=912552 RepID=A0A840IHF6_9ACTN|nr:quercetin dioxygenase-like cupin family protein [Conexibacter arvalis]
MDVQPHQPVVLHSDDGAARVVAISLPAGEELQDHEVHEHAWLHVHRGAVEVDAEDGSSRRAGAGALVHWRPGERHAVRAVDDALLVLLLAPWPGPGHPNLRAGGATSAGPFRDSAVTAGEGDGDPAIPVGQAEPELRDRAPGAPPTAPLDPPSAG